MTWCWEMAISFPVELKARDTEQAKGTALSTLNHCHHLSCCSAFICILNLPFGMGGEGLLVPQRSMEVLGCAVQDNGWRSQLPPIYLFLSPLFIGVCFQKNSLK